MTHVEKAKQIAKNLKPKEGWWKSSTEDAVITVATFMLAGGMSCADTENLCAILINACREEYGE